MDLQQLDLETILAEIGRDSPSISGSTAALVTAQLGTAMVRMALAVSLRHDHNTDLFLERLDSIFSQLKLATENDRAASATLIDAYRQNAESEARRSALYDATRRPLSAARLLVELLELLVDASKEVSDIVASDFAGGVEVVKAAFWAVMMAVQCNLNDDDDDRTGAEFYSGSSLFTRFDLAVKSIRPGKSS